MSLSSNTKESRRSLTHCKIKIQSITPKCLSHVMEFSHIPKLGSKLWKHSLKCLLKNVLMLKLEQLLRILKVEILNRYKEYKIQ